MSHVIGCNFKHPPLDSFISKQKQDWELVSGCALSPLFNSFVCLKSDDIPLCPLLCRFFFVCLLAVDGNIGLVDGWRMNPTDLDDSLTLPLSQDTGLVTTKFDATSSYNCNFSYFSGKNFFLSALKN